MNWSNLTIKQYYSILDATKKDLSDLELSAELIKIIFNRDIEDLPYIKSLSLIKQLDFLRTPYEPSLIKKCFKIGNKEFIPVTDISKITTAQYIDFQTLYKQEDWKHLLNCLFICKGEKYGDNDYSDLLWDYLSATDYIDTLFFFLKFWKKYTVDTLRSSLKLVKTEEEKKTLQTLIQEIMDD